MKLPDFIRSNMEKILQEWENHAFQLQPDHGSMSKEELRDHAEKILLDIANGIDRSRSTHFRGERSRGLHPILGKALRSAVEHGITRHGFGFDINDVISEYRALRTKVIRLWADSVQEDPLWDEILLFNEELDGVIKEAVEAFTVLADKQKWLLERVITSSRDHCYLLDKEGRFIYANTSMLKDLNITFSALMGRNHHNLHLGSEILYEEVLKVLETGEERNGEVTYSLPSGEERTYEYLYEPILNDQEIIEGITALERDITERKRTENLIIEREKRLRLATDAAQLGVFIWDVRNDRPIWDNARIFEIFGLSPQDKPINLELFEAEVIHPEDLPRFRHEIMESMQNGTPFMGSYRIRRFNDGRWRWIEYLGRFDYADNGDVIRLLSVLSDITERKATEENLRYRTEELAAANRELEAFSYSVSHDLRAPLRAISGFLALFRKHTGKLDDTADKYLRRAEFGAKKMDHLIDDMLRLSKISKQEMVFEELDLSTMAKVVTRELELQHPERQVETRIVDGIRARGDVQLIKIVLANLLGNAWKYTEKKAEARVEFGSCRKNEKKVFFVRDNGAGFPMEQSDRLLEPFQRLHSESEFPGTGIGLPIVHRVVSRHGGEIWAEGEVDKGAAFYFTLGSR